MKKKKSVPSIGAVKLESTDILPHSAVYLLGLMLSLPFLNPIHRLPIPSFYSEWVAIFVVLFAGMMLFISKASQTKTVEIPYIITLPLFLAIVIFFQWVLGYFAYFSSALTSIFFLIWAMSIVQITSHCLKILPQELVLPRLAYFVLIGGLINAIFGALQFFELNQFLTAVISEAMPLSQSGVYGNLAQQNHFSTHLSLSLAALLFLYKSNQMGYKKTLSIAFILIIGLFLSGSRSTFLYLICCGFFFFGFKAKIKNKVFIKRILLLCVSAVVILSLLLMISNFLGIKFPQLHRYLYFSETVGARSFLWGHAWLMFLNNPFLGVGWDAFAFQLIEQIGQSNKENLWGVDQYAHNFGLQLLACVGLFGFLSVMIPAAKFLLRQRTRPLCVNRQWWFCSLIILLIHSSLEQPLYYAYFLGFASFIIACLETKHYTIKLSGMRRGFILIFFILGIATSCKTWLDYRYIEKTFFDSNNQQSNIPINNENVHNLHKWSLFVGLIESMRPDIFVPNQSRVEDKIALNKRLMHFSPLAETEFRHAALLAESGDVIGAQHRFRIAALAYPEQLNLYTERFKILAINEPENYKEISEYAENLQLSKR